VCASIFLDDCSYNEAPWVQSSSAQVPKISVTQKTHLIPTGNQHHTLRKITIGQNFLLQTFI